MGLIYMRTSPSGKSYIGQTIQSEQTRWNQHCRDAYNCSSPLYETILSKAIRKYGKNNFSVTILKDNIPKEELNQYEEYYIQLYNTYFNGYNSSFGGEGGGQKYNYDDFYQLWQEGKTITEISKINKCPLNTVHRILKACGVSEEQMKNRFVEGIRMFDEQQRNNLKQAYERGASISQLSKQYDASYTAIRNALKWTNTNMRPAQGIESNSVAQIDIKTNQIINIYPSARKAAKAVNGAHQSIGVVANHQKNRKIAYGYHWEWEKNLKEYFNGKSN